MRFGTSMAAAHRRLGGRLGVNPSGGLCGDLLGKATGWLDGSYYRRTHEVASIHVNHGMAYPLGVDDTMSPRQVVARVRRSGLPSRSYRASALHPGQLERDTLVVGPGGHTLFFSFVEGSDQITTMGVSINRDVATAQMEHIPC